MIASLIMRMSCLIASLIRSKSSSSLILHDCVPHHANELPDCVPHQVQKLIELESCKGRGVEVSARKD